MPMTPQTHYSRLWIHQITQIRRPLVGHQAVKECLATYKSTPSSPCNLLVRSPKLPVSLVSLQLHIIKASWLLQTGYKMLSVTPGDLAVSPPLAIFPQAGDPRLPALEATAAACFRSTKNQKNCSQDFHKTTEFMHEIHKTRFLWKVDFCNTLHAKTLNFEPQASKLRLRNR